LLSDTTIRLFHEDDLPYVYELIHKTIDTSYRADYSARVIGLFKEFHSRENILEDTKNGCTLVALHSGEIVGTGTLLDAHIRRVFVNSSFQGRGIGTLIANELEKIASNNSVTVLNLAAALGSRTFWESRGFIVQEEIFAPVREDIVIHYYIMEKPLNSLRK
jgi:GNAT superfamily N-acetyltransferase